ncbi:MAG: amino acid ABC transporter ATP-binding protein [Janthinobacterium lividum]
MPMPGSVPPAAAAPAHAPPAFAALADAPSPTGRAALAPAPLLAVDRLHKRFGEKVILDAVSLDVDQGETVVLIGPSGSGKTTLLRCLNFLEAPDGGTIRLHGETIGRTAAGAPLPEALLARQRRRFGFVFQRFNLFAHLSARDNVACGPRRVLGLSRDAAQERAREALDRVHLAGHMDKRPGQLSGGQQQRVAIARALAMQPELLLFDEPTSALDPELVREVLDVMRDLAHASMTMLVVTHEMAFARQVADRVVFMDGGEVVETGSAEHLFGAPREARTRRFLQHLSHDAEA